MFVLVRGCEGLLVAHAYLFASFVLGSSILSWPDKREVTGDLSAAQLMMRVAGTAALGLSLVGFSALFLAFLHELQPAAILGLLVLEMLGASMWRRRNLFCATFWTLRLHILGKCWNGGILATYYALIVLSIPAVMGNIGGSDPIGYHLVYAKEWANAGGLTIDPFLRLPFYASNFLLLFSIVMSFGGDVFVNYMTWVPCVLAALGMCASIATVLENRIGGTHASITAFTLTLSAFLAPANLRWLPTAYIDAPIGAFAFLALLCLLLAIREKEKDWVFCGAIVAAFLIGMKGSFLLLVPVYFAALVIVARYLRLPIRTIAAIALLFIFAASPWYVRNLIMAGDPAPPVLNIALHGNDGLMTKGEWALNSADLATDKSMKALVSLPLRAYLSPVSLREYGTTALVLVLYAPLLVLLLLFANGRRLDPSLVIASFLLLASAAYWAFTSAWLRYDTIFYFFLPTTVGLLLAQIPAGRVARSISIVAALVLVLPSPGTAQYFKETFNRDYRYLPGSYTADSSLQRYGEGYTEAEYSARVLRERQLTGRVFMVGTRVGYYFYEHRIEAIGDWMGPAGWMRLYRAVDAGRAASFLTGLGVDAVLMDPAHVLGGLDVPLERQLLANGYCSVEIPNSRQVLFVRSQLGSCLKGSNDG